MQALYFKWNQKGFSFVCCSWPIFILDQVNPLLMAWCPFLHALTDADPREFSPQRLLPRGKLTHDKYIQVVEYLLKTLKFQMNGWQVPITQLQQLSTNSQLHFV